MLFRSNISPAVSDSPEGQITHLIVKPADAGLVSSMTVETNQRTYAVKLVSTQHEWMPLVAFNYPDDTRRQWSAYRTNVAFAATASGSPAGGNTQNLDFGFRIRGDHPRWRPLSASSLVLLQKGGFGAWHLPAEAAHRQGPDGARR